MGSGQLRVPIRVADGYATPGAERSLFPGHPYYLTRDEVLEAFPDGLIPFEKFSTHSHSWRLAKRVIPNGQTVYLAVLDDGNTASITSTAHHQQDHMSNAYTNGHAHTASNTLSSPDTFQRLRSMPLDSLTDSFDGPTHSNLHPHCTDLAPAGSHHLMPHHAASSSALLHRPPHGPSLLHNRPNSTNSLLHAVNSMPAGALAAHNGAFMTDLLAATESPMPLDRFKAFCRLFSALDRMRETMGLPPATPANVTNNRTNGNANGSAHKLAWDAPEAHEHVKQVLMVGECLAKFGTAEFVQGGNNSSRAITTKDYAKLLVMYLQDNGALFMDDYMHRLPVGLQDEALAVRSLLQTRCETNDMLFNQLVKHVGQEPTGGGAVVFNNSSVSANPSNHMLAAPKTLVNTVSNAWAKADVKRRTQLGALGAVAVVALWVLKRKLFGGGGGGKRWKDESEWGGARRSRPIRGSGDLAARLLDEKSSAERMAVRYLAACQDELRRAAANDALLRNDWRLGPLRLAMPGSGSVPYGYEPVATQYCSVASYMNALDGGPPFAMPYSGGYGGAERERAAGMGMAMGMPAGLALGVPVGMIGGGKGGKGEPVGQAASGLD